VLAALIGGAVMAVVAGAAAQSGAAPGAAWSTPRALVPSSQYAFSPALAVGEDGEAIAGWFGGTPPQVVMGAARAVAVRAAKWTGSTVVVDRGTVVGGFKLPVVLSRHGTDQPNGLHVALSGPGVAYAAWSEFPGAWMVATAPPNGEFSAPRPLLPAGGQLIALASGTAGPVLAVWAEFPPLRLHQHGSLDYARLGPGGQLGRTVMLSSLQGDDSAQTAVAVNDRGALVAAWVRGVGSPASVVRAVLCTATGRCAVTPSVESFRTAPFNVAVALAGDGTASVVSDVGINGGVLAEASRDGGPFSLAQRLASTGSAPVATADGLDGALAVFTGQIGGFARGLVWSLLPATGTRFAKARAVGDPNAIYSPVLAANLAGQFVIAWNDQAGTNANAAYSSVAAATGSGQRLSRPAVIAPSDVAAQTIKTGIDGAGNAIVIWNKWVGHEPRGVFAAVHHS
jgi:hypothetical protein